MKAVFILLAIGLVIWIASVVLKTDTWQGIYVSNVTGNTGTIKVKDRSECEAWLEQVSTNHSIREAECGKNCKLNTNATYMCEETF